jgi:hypothetical protein
MMVLLASTYDQSKFFRAEDLAGEKTFRIKSVTEELVGQGADQQMKLVVWFTNSSKGLPLNRTNNRTIRGAYGDDTAGWAKQLIVVFPTQAEFRGRLVGALRVRIPPPKQGTSRPSSTAEAVNTVAAPPPPEARPAPATPEPEDLDDEIPY